ncbi:hypothetical protein R55214_HHFBAMCI_01523 [Fructobacillus evanidus]|uniref:Uncharacterized protein n=2 Tax=Fructobacillus evanidus TaxID=3064281 RepID=A0ABN9YZ92_9LACO|nr:hypothetical protein R55250_KEHBDPNM_01434 [Fructobacillus sp. LMG 32999]CAK1249384.1 hypothetical protein R53718_MFFEMHAI_01583 [Fructobacillus sp. LMG 32999]CAK1252771.1 hypothetical protein R54837_OMAIDLJD_01424 [Fructobacillus sp. LMG 32999]CAK1252895.1 hypothetical protein R53534_HOPDCFKK_01424 [Fructobacillus sp. LMG 32999]CAK1253170.1 hypothetical protein R55203_MFJFHIJN_01434 [Fructobacillus sp. LMG 32999]
MLISPLKKRPYLSKCFLALFIILSIMLRFNSGFLELMDTVFAIIAQEIASHFLFLAGPANVMGSLWFIWLVNICWALFIRSLGFKVGSWWAINVTTIFFISMIIWSAAVFLNWDHGLTLDQTMPDLSLAMWALFFFEFDNILVRRLHVAHWVKTTIQTVFVLTWIVLAGNKMVGSDLSFTTVLGAFLLAYIYFRLAAKVYLKHVKKSWLVIFAVDGDI